MKSSKRCSMIWWPLTKLIKCSTWPRDRAELAFTWLNLAKKHQTLAQLQPLVITIWSSHSIENQAHSFTEASRLSKWPTNSVVTTKIGAWVSKCLSTMVAKTWIFALYLLHYAHSFHKHQVQATSIESKVKIELPSHISEREQPRKEISTQLLTLQPPWDARLYSTAEITCMLSLPQLMTNMQVTVSLWEVSPTVFQPSG